MKWHGSWRTKLTLPRCLPWLTQELRKSSKPVGSKPFVSAASGSSSSRAFTTETLPYQRRPQRGAFAVRLACVQERAVCWSLRSVLVAE